MEFVKELPALGRDLGPGFIFIGILSLVAVIVGCIYQEWSSIPVMLTASAALCLLGLIFRCLPQNGRKPRVSSSIAAVAFMWGLISLCGALPFFIGEASFVDALFESMSAWSGTGFSVISDIEEWPHALLFWRSMMQWLGGLGIIAFALSMISRVGINRGLSLSENKADSFLPSVASTVKQIWKIYTVLTVIAFLAILCTGVGIWDALNLAFCSISTGGMSLYSDGLLHYDNVALEMVLIPIMFLGAIPFRLYYLTYKKHSFKEMLHDRVLQVMFIIFGVIAAVNILELVFASGMPVGDAFRQGLFMAGTAVTSTGFQNTDFLLWGISPLIILGAFMLMGGPQGSTSGGLKIERIIILFESIVWWIRKMVSGPKSVVNLRHEGKAVKSEETAPLISGSLVLILSFLILMVIVLMIFMHDAYFTANIEATIFDMFSCIGNNGTSCGVIGPQMPDYAKVILFFVMWIARLEIIPVLILIRGIFKGFNW
ncbi:MAG TPA: TrkH family potassium uptake protein [Methanocorpusculum sp.]|nr:TrkH family potassium uptake protein [Methanocorpusculum sp.]